LQKFLDNPEVKVTVLTDHRNLEAFAHKQLLNSRQCRWAEFLANFHFEVAYIRGSENRADALSRRPDYAAGPDEEVSRGREQAVLPPFVYVDALSTRNVDTDMAARIAAALTADARAAEIMAWLAGDKQGTAPAVPDVDSYTSLGDLLLYKGRVYVPDNEQLKLEVLALHHDSKVAGHFGRAKTYLLLSRLYFWPGMRKFTAAYVKGCDVCALNKPTRHGPRAPLQPLQVPERPWWSLSVDFIVKLPKSSGFDSIMVVVDRLTKMAVCVPCCEAMSAEEFAKLFVERVFCEHGLPKDIVSDRGATFLSRFWGRICEILGVKLKFSSAFHPQTDGQTERVNQVLEQYLRMYTNYCQDDWASLLPLATFSYNNAEHASTRCSPFFANYGYHPEFHMPVVTEQRVPAAENRLEELRKAQEVLKAQLHEAVAAYTEQHDKGLAVAPRFTVGQKVLLRTDNIKSKRPSAKLDRRHLGPFVITEKINEVAFRLDLKGLRIHDVFHANLLEPYQGDAPDALPGRPRPAVAPMPVKVTSAGAFWEVDSVLDSRVKAGRLEYFIRWKGFSAESDSWEPHELVKHLPALLRRFHEAHPDKPKPGRL
jgi:transposase InsO family protein